jgi:hypothetical protein
VALVFVVSGVVIYEMAPSPVVAAGLGGEVGEKGRDQEEAPYAIGSVPSQDRVVLAEEDHLELAATDRTTSLT